MKCGSTGQLSFETAWRVWGQDDVVLPRERTHFLKRIVNLDVRIKINDMVLPLIEQPPQKRGLTAVANSVTS